MLTDLQARFVDEYLIDLNGAQAAIRAGSKAERPDQAAYEFLRNPEVASAIAERQAERSKATKIDAAWVLTRLADEATADVADIYGDDGQLLPIKQWPLIWRQGLVSGMDVETIRKAGSGGSGQWHGQAQDVHEPDPADEQETVITKIKLSDRIRRLELIGKHIGVQAFQDNVSHTGLERLAERLAKLPE